ncbi:lactose-binding lectin l-2-like [Epinephelus moara]|uniref:lactose-binding lectin l-2-like n=1 Tax=Epinephelus moara TaxID=300413 RepID=UPI00214F1AED|nr:lactose-binding lectin l-2-like [Epinephelus moara]
MLLFLFMFGLALGAVSPSDVHQVKLQRGACPMFWYSFNGRCFKYIATRMTWADAELHCVRQGANLASIHSLDEHNFVRFLISNFDHAKGWTWIGLTDIHREGRWTWSDGSRVNFVLWDVRQPDNAGGREHCGHVNFGSNRRWNDHQCHNAFASVCVFRKIC